MLRQIMGGIFMVVVGCNAPLLAQEQPDAHIMLETPKPMDAAEAEAVYDELRQRMLELYGMADYGPAAVYQSWRRFNSAPYISATHGNRYVNNFANELGNRYGGLAEGERYPAGAILAKDSISALDDGGVFPGALFIMEKLEAGGDPDTADWRYVMVLPDGSIFGDTRGDNPQKVAYCHPCHEQVADDDYGFFIPEEFRAE